MRGFLYGQTEYNLLSNTNHLDDYVNLAKECSFDFLSITDSNLYGSYKFYKKCISNGIKPIIGLEYTFITEDQNLSKVLLYAENNEGYKNLLKISTRVKTEGINTLDDLLEYKNNILFIFVFNDSFIERLIINKNYGILDEFLANINRFSGYIGVSYTNKLVKLELTKFIENYTKNHNIECLPIHQCKYLKKEDLCIYDALTKIAGINDHITEFDDFSFDLNPLNDDRIISFVNKINLDLFKDNIKLPKYPNTKGKPSKEYLYALCHKGLEKRGKYINQYVSRLNYELSVINKMGYDDYFLIVWDFIKYAKNNNILVGPGRGSAAGSLVSYCLGITEVDPIPYDLLFERFLNPERISMPDIDTDFPDIHRDDVINHVKELYGEKHVCNISAFGTFQIKSSVRELSKVFNIEQGRIEKISDMIEKYGYDKLLEEYKDSDMYTFLYVSRGLENLPKHISTHAAGIILSSSPLDDIIPLQEGINGLYQSQFEASDLEAIGLLKMDFLGIRNLTMVSSMMQQIPGFDIHKLRGIPLDDSKTYNLLQRADTLGIFQLESQGIRNTLSRLKPTCFEDLVAVLALYRPGPMDNIDEFIRRKHGGKFEYLHENLKPILSNTYGIIVYQEQIMKIAQVFAGYSLGDADILRRAVSKKKADVLESMSNDFINKCLNNGYDKKVATDIYDLIYKFANYGFNKSHSVAYAMLSYQMAYIKANYFPVFMANILNNVISNTSSMVSYIKYARQNGLKTLKPNINISTNKFVYEKNRLFIPLNAIHSIGEVATKQIVEERNQNGLFKNYNDFKQRCSFLSTAVITALVYSGALDIFGKTKKSMTNSASEEDMLFLKYMDNVLEINDEYDIDYLKEQEYHYLGMNIEYNLFVNVKEINKKYNTIPISKLPLKKISNILVEFTDFRIIKTKKNEDMFIGDISDENGNTLKSVLFPSNYSKLSFKIQKNKLYLVSGILEYDNKNELSFSIFEVNII